MSTRLFLHLTTLLVLFLMGCASRPTSAPEPQSPNSPNMDNLSPTPASTPSPSTDVTAPDASQTATPANPVAPDRLQKKMTDLSIADLATRLAVAPETIEIIAAESILWPNSALGCPQPDRVYAQGQVPGYRIKLAAAGQEYLYHTNQTGIFLLCQAGGLDDADLPTTPISPGDTLGGQRP